MSRSFKDALNKALIENPEHGLADIIKNKPATPKKTNSIPTTKASVNTPIARPASKKVSKSPVRKTTPRYRHLQDERITYQPTATSGPPKIRLNFSGEPQLNWQPSLNSKRNLLKINILKGARTNISTGNNLVPRELVMGIDFGTSCTKLLSTIQA